MPPKRRRRFQGLYYHSSPPKVLPMNGQISNSNGRRKRDPDDFSVKLSTIRIWMHEKDIGKLTRVLWAGQGTRLRQQASTNPKVKRFLAAVPYVMNSIKDVHQAVIDNNLETLQTHLEPPVPPALVTCRDANGLNLIHKAAGLGHATILEYLITTWPDGVHETDITGKTPLHWAASAKNNMRCYTLLTQAGCDEEAVDYKMKTPSYYRHKPNEIERAFLTYVPEAPRVSPDVATDWEALSDDSGDGKKLDIKIPEMNGFGRHSNAESNENTSEAEMIEAASGQEDEDMSKDGDAAENDQEPAEENEKLEEEDEPTSSENDNQTEEKEPEAEQDHELEQKTDESSEKEEEQEDGTKNEPEETQETKEDSNNDQANENGDQNEKQPQQQNENLNESIENLSKDLPVTEIEKDVKKTEEIKENTEIGEEKSDKDNDKNLTSKENQITEESKEGIELSEDTKETSIESSDKEPESKEGDHVKEVTETDKDLKDREEDQAAKENETKEVKEEEKETLVEQATEEKSNKAIKENTGEQTSDKETKDMKEEQIEQNDTIENLEADGKQEKLAEDKKMQAELKNEKDLESEIVKTLEENKNNDKEQHTEVIKALDDNKMNDNHKENIEGNEDIEKNANEVGIKEEGEENLKTVSEALENIKEEVKDNVKYLANQIQNLFKDSEDNETNEKDDKQKEQKSDKENQEQATQGTTDTRSIEEITDKNQEETKDKTLENKTEDEKSKENNSEDKNYKTNEASTNDLETNNLENKNEKINEFSTISHSVNAIEATTYQEQSKIETGEGKQYSEIPGNSKTPQDQLTTAKVIEESQTALAGDKPSSAKQTFLTKDKPSSAQHTPKKETEKTEEDENNNNNSKYNDSITTLKETTDSEYEKLNQALEQYKKEENEEKEHEKENEKHQEQEHKESTDLGHKLEDMADSMKENVKVMADKVKNIFTSNDDKMNEKQELEASNVVVHSADGGKLNGIKTLEKSVESSDDTGDEDEDTEKETENNDNNEEEQAAANETTDVKETETELENQAADDEKNEEEFAEDEEHEGDDASPTSSLDIEGFVQGDAEDNTVQSQTAAFDHDDKESRIQSIIASGDMEQLAQIVLNGDGQKLLNVEATEPEIQAFLRNVPNYMNKIRRVHEAARSGSLLNLQQALDRRKFAIAKDEISPNGATPLHVAVLFGHSDIVRYLSARFPETTTITDNDGRTPLHYAAVISDNGHFYNVLLQLGANPKLPDKLGHTPDDYLSKEELKDTLNYGQLLKNFNAEELEEQLLSDQGQIENHSIQENPIFKTEQGKYLADNLADPLIKALTQVAQKRPSDPLQYLTNYLQNYAATRNTNGRTITQAAIHTGSSQTNSTVLANSKSSTPPTQQQLMSRQASRMNGHIKNDNSNNIEDDDAMQRIEEFNDNNAADDDDGNDSEAEISKKLEERDEHGQSMLHFACARSHRKGGLIHLIEESKADITYRDELYRTARDVALQANQLGNAKEIDRYVLSLAIVGDIKPFEHFAINGYDHIIDVLDDNETPIIDVVASRGQNELAQYLRSIRPLEELREELHQMIRENNVERVKEIANGPNGRWLIKAKNYYGRTALHIAILKESIEIVEMFVKLAPEALKIGDNLERTPLHYGMGTNIFENISRILIQSGAKRTYKDLKGRQPSYYFMNKADILRLQEEEDENR